MRSPSTILFLLACLLPRFSFATWKRSRLEHCELHPDLGLRIQRDVGFWGETGISEDLALSVCKFCDLPPQSFRQKSHHHHHHQQRRQRNLQVQQQEEQEQQQQEEQQQALGQHREASDGPEAGDEAASAMPADAAIGASTSRKRQRQQRKEEEEQQELTRARGQRRRLQQQQGQPAGPDCNKPQRVLIQNGTVFLTNLVAADSLGPFEHIGFLVELYEASQVYRLPDVEFTYWFGDNAPGHTRVNPDGTTTWTYSPTGSVPAVLAWSKWDGNAALVVPYSGAFRCSQDSWDAIESQLENLAAVPWSERKEIAFGRWNAFCTHYIPWSNTADGQVMKCPRTHLNELAKANPDLLDTYDLGRARPLPLAHQNAYKYIVSTDGWSISSKFDKYLLLGSAVLKAETTRYGFYYDAIKPYKHYLPFMVNSSDDILDVVRWAKSHDEQARRVAEEGQRFALQHLNRQARLCYLFRLLSELAKKMRYKPSCERRQLCVPLVREIRFLHSYKRTAQSCRYQEVLLRYGKEDPSDLDPHSSLDPGDEQQQQQWRSSPAGSRAFSLEDLQRLHESGTAWPRDDLLQ